MRQSRVKQLRRLFIDQFLPGDPRNKTLFRSLKREYKALPHTDRFAFMRGLELAKANYIRSYAQ